MVDYRSHYKVDLASRIAANPSTLNSGLQAVM